MLNTEKNSESTTININEAKIRQAYADLTRLLIQKGLTITTMESATSGQIASLITDTEGSSAILKGAFVTYCNEAKVQMGVPADTIKNYGVYSEETALAMAAAARKAYDANIAIGVTGTMGNIDPANNDSVPGQVYFAIALKTNVEATYSFYRELPPQPSRLSYKLLVAWEVLQELLPLL